jgi:hypothetical protein
MDQDRKSKMEPAEGSRETVLDNERTGRRDQSGEHMRNRESSSRDLGSSSDRAMMTGGSDEARDESSESSMGSSSGSSGMTSERGRGSSGERNSGSTGSRSSNTGGITNRELDREQSEQEQLPERGRSQSER